MNFQPKTQLKTSSSNDPLVESRTIYYNPTPPTQPYQGPKNVLYESNPSIKIDIPKVKNLDSYKLKDSYNNVYSPTYGTSQTTYQSPRLPNSDVKTPRESPLLQDGRYNYENHKQNYASIPTQYTMTSPQPMRLTNHAFEEYIKTKRITSLDNQQRTPRSDFVPTSNNKDHKQSQYYKSTIFNPTSQVLQSNKPEPKLRHERSITMKPSQQPSSQHPHKNANYSACVVF